MKRSFPPPFIVRSSNLACVPFGDQLASDGNLSVFGGCWHKALPVPSVFIFAVGSSNLCVCLHFILQVAFPNYLCCSWWCLSPLGDFWTELYKLFHFLGCVTGNNPGFGFDPVESQTAHPQKSLQGYDPNWHLFITWNKHILKKLKF